MSGNKNNNPDTETLNDFKSVIENPANNIIPDWKGKTDIYTLRGMDGGDIFYIEKKQISYENYEYKLSMYWIDDKKLEPYAKDVFSMTDQEYKKREKLGDLRRFLYRYRGNSVKYR